MKMEKVLLRERYLKSRTALVATVCFFSLIFCFFGARFIRFADLSILHQALLPVVAFFMPLMLYTQSEAGYRARSVHKLPSASYLPRLLLWLLGLVLVSVALFVLSEKAFTVYGISFSVPKTPAAWVSAIAAFVLFPSLFEEMTLRGAWQGEVEEQGVLGAVCTSALMTAAFGFNVYSCVYLLVGGFVFAIIKAQSGSFYASFLVSALWRAVMLVLLPLFDDALLALPLRPLLASIAFILGAVILYFAYDKNICIGRKLYERGQKIFFSVFSFAVLLLTASLVLLNGVWT